MFFNCRCYKLCCFVKADFLMVRPRVMLAQGAELNSQSAAPRCIHTAHRHKKYTLTGCVTSLSCK